MKKYNYSYKITNLLNGKYYLGVHSTDSLYDTYFGSGTALKAAIQKYGKENFEMVILDFFDTREELLAWEKRAVTEEQLQDENCYNIKTGGDNLIVYSEESRRKMSDSHRGKCNSKESYIKATETKKLRGSGKKSEEEKKAIGERMKGIPKSRESIQKGLETRRKRGRHQQKPEVRAKNSAAHKGHPSGTAGKIHIFRGDEETLIFPEKLQEYLDLGWQKGRKRSVISALSVAKIGKPSKLRGIPRSEEVREKIRQSSFGKVGTNIGKVWIYRDSEEIMILKENLEQYIQQGWQRGRVFKTM